MKVKHLRTNLQKLDAEMDVLLFQQGGFFALAPDQPRVAVRHDTGERVVIFRAETPPTVSEPAPRKFSLWSRKRQT